MSRLSRRAFARTLLTAAIIPPLAQAKQLQPNTSKSSGPPVAGYTPSHDEQRLLEKFTGEHEQRMSALREHQLPNSLSPLFLIRPPAKGRSKS